METKQPAMPKRPPLTWADVLTAPEKRRLRQGLPLLPRGDQRDLLKLAGSFEDDAILSNDEIESMGLKHE
jgi:hypothetical protein